MPRDTRRRQESETVSEEVSKPVVVIPCLGVLIDLSMKFLGTDLASKCRKAWHDLRCIEFLGMLFLQELHGRTPVLNKPECHE
jgi:hypothetical protein